MNTRRQTQSIHSFAWIVLLLLFAGIQASAQNDKRERRDNSQRKPSASVGEAIAATPMRDVPRPEVEALIATWPERPRLGARMMITNYGMPQGATPEALVWLNQGPFKCIKVYREEVPHNSPKPHTDFVEHTVVMRVPTGRVGMISQADGSVAVNRTSGEVSARCDLESNNIIALNVAHDIATGKRDADEGGDFITRTIAENLQGKNPEYAQKLLFSPSRIGGDPGVSHIPGAPVRQDMGTLDGKADKNKAQLGDDSEVLGKLTAIDEKEIVAAIAVKDRKASGPIHEYATTLHKDHGGNLAKTMAVADKTGNRPLLTEMTEAEIKKGAAELAALLTLPDDEFDKAFIDAMVRGHEEALKKIDDELIPAAKNEAVKQHLKEARGHVAHHLELARRLAAERR